MSETKKTNIYGKLAEARVMLQQIEMKKSGNNKFAGYTYFELGDFLPHINAIQAKLGIASIISFDSDYATMTIVNIEEPTEQITFKCEVKEAQLKGCHPIQNYGAVQTYTRRYLYQLAYEIVEHDILEIKTGTEEGKPTGFKPTEKEMQIYKNLLAASGYEEAKIFTSYSAKLKKEVNKNNWTAQDYKTILAMLQKKVDEKGA